MEKPKLTGDILYHLNSGLAQEILRHSFKNPKLNMPVEPTDLVFHYTTLEKFIAILTSQSFYFTNLNYLNDSREFQHGVGIIRDVVRNYAPTEANEPILQSLEKNIEEIFKSPRYVACFSKDGDLLSQWRAYANDGKGLAIGFDTDKIDDFEALNISGKYILYDEVVQRRAIEEVFTISLNYFEGAKDLIDWTGFDYEYIIATSIINILEEFISMFKHPSFSEEMEYRLEYCVDGKMNKPEQYEERFRATENLIIPFIKMPYTNSDEDDDLDNPEAPPRLNKKLPIKKIIIGASLNFELNKKSIQNLLMANGYYDVEIVESKIPYRL